MPLLSKAETKALIEGVWSGVYNAEKLPYWLFSKLADGLQGAAVEGWGNELGAGKVIDLELEKAMQENIFYFAAHKAAHECKDLHQLYVGSENKYQFVKKALQVNEKYNRFWYETEYSVTTRIARAGREWQQIEETKEVYPKLRFVAVQDGNQRASHQALHGVIRPVDDPFWKTYFIPLDWNCRCRVERLESGQNTNLARIDKPTVIDQFKERVTDSKKIWHDSHPYFGGLPNKTIACINSMVTQKLNDLRK